MEDEVLLGITNKHHDVSEYTYKKMMQTLDPSSSYNVDHPKICITTNKHSRLITKQKPHKIRIIHIVPPEIIHTDKANFRDLVQSLTGQSSSTTKTGNKKPLRPKESSSYENMGYVLDHRTGPTDIKLNPNKKLCDISPKHEQIYLATESDLEVLIDGILAKVENEELMLPEWPGMEDDLETEFFINECLELSEWLPKDTGMPDMMTHVDPN